MALTNTQHDAIMRQYNLIQARNRQLTKQRIDEVYSAHPDISALDRQIVELSAQCAPAIITGHMDIKEYQDNLCKFNEQRADLLALYGYPNGYLDGVFDCSICHDTGYVDGKKCQCFYKRAVDLLYTQSNVKNIIAHENFDTFNLDCYSRDPAERNHTTNDTPYDNMCKILAKAKSFVENFDCCHDNLLFYGGTGIGKTFLSNCIADALLKSVHSVIYLTAIELFDIFSGQDFRTCDADKELPASHFCLDCDLLIIDDLGTEVQNSFTGSKLFYCLNERILRSKSTLISTNLGLRDLRDQYGERIFSRISSNYKILYFYGDDIRIKQRQNRSTAR